MISMSIEQSDDKKLHTSSPHRPIILPVLMVLAFMVVSASQMTSKPWIKVLRAGPARADDLLQDLPSDNDHVWCYECHDPWNDAEDMHDDACPEIDFCRQDYNLSQLENSGKILDDWAAMLVDGDDVLDDDAVMNVRSARDTYCRAVQSTMTTKDGVAGCYEPNKKHEIGGFKRVCDQNYQASKEKCEGDWPIWKPLILSGKVTLKSAREQSCQVINATAKGEKWKKKVR